jgi:hypothetical protein
MGITYLKFIILHIGNSLDIKYRMGEVRTLDIGWKSHDTRLRIGKPEH